MGFHGTKYKLFLIYVLLRFLCISIFFMLKTLKIKKKMEKIIAKKSVFAMKKVLIHKNLEIATLRSITT